MCHTCYYIPVDIYVKVWVPSYDYIYFSMLRYSYDYIDISTLRYSYDYIDISLYIYIYVKIVMITYISKAIMFLWFPKQWSDAKEGQYKT